MAPPPVEDPLRAWEARERHLATFDRWEAAGRLAVAAQEESFTARIDWRQQLEEYRVRLSGPLGQGVAELEGGPGGVVLRAPNEADLAAASASELLRARLGWEMPLEGRRFWLQGRAAPGEPPTALDLDPAGRPERLEQAGWVVHFREWRESDGIEMPRRVDLEHPRLRARLVLGSWRLGA